jgi:hypothetical protein
VMTRRVQVDWGTPRSLTDIFDLLTKYFVPVMSWLL